MEERQQVRIFVFPAAKEAIKDFAGSFDMTEQGVASRLFEWFSRQPVAVQKWVIGLTDAKEAVGMEDFAAQLIAAVKEANALRNSAMSRPFKLGDWPETTTVAPPDKTSRPKKG